MFYEGEWQATGNLYELSEETGYTKDYLSEMIKGSKRRENYIKCKKLKKEPKMLLIEI